MLTGSLIMLLQIAHVNSLAKTPLLARELSKPISLFLIAIFIKFRVEFLNLSMLSVWFFYTRTNKNNLLHVNPKIKNIHNKLNKDKKQLYHEIKSLLFIKSRLFRKTVTNNYLVHTCVFFQQIHRAICGCAYICKYIEGVFYSAWLLMSFALITLASMF